MVYCTISTTSYESFHNIALEYCGKVFVNDFVTVRKRNWIQNFKNALRLLVLICYYGGTCLIRLLHFKKSQNTKKLLVHCVLSWQYILLIHVVFEYISMTITLCRCIIYAQDLFVNSTVMSILKLIVLVMLRINKYIWILYCFSVQIQL